MKYTESQLEQAFISLLETEGYRYINGKELLRTSNQDVLIKEDLRAFLLARYPDLEEIELESLVNELAFQSASNLYESNKYICKLLADGLIFKRNNPLKKDLHIRYIDVENIKENSFKIVNQLEIQGSELRIPDLILYINGIPVVVFEFKTAIEEEITIHDAFKQLTVRYRRDIPELMKYNVFCVISDGVNNKSGTIFSPYEFYYGWNKITGEEKKALTGIETTTSIVHGMLNQNRLVDIIHHFVLFPDTSKNELKILTRYPQYYASNKLYQNILKHRKPEGDGKGGTYFGATGCGKSYTMLYLSRLLMRSTDFASPTIIIISDRTDLDDQLSKDFTNAKKFIGDENIINIESRADLRDRLRGIESGGVYLTTVQKFAEDADILSDRTNIICISDEAHRSQVNLDLKVKIDEEKGITKSYGFAKYLHDSLPNATYVGFTGTPIDKTLEVFGDIIDQYTMFESVNDEITVRLVYEGRAAKVNLDYNKVQEIETYYENAVAEGASEYHVEASQKAIAKMEVVLGDKDRIKAIAKDFINHYENRIEEKATVAGKAMFVCASRGIAYKLYQEILGRLSSRLDPTPNNISSRLDENSHPFAQSRNFEQPSEFFTHSFGFPEEWHVRNLPHRNRENLLQFITFRLADSLPQNVLKEIEEEIKHLSDKDKEVEKRKKYEYWLDKDLGSCALAKKEMAQVVLEAFQYHDKVKYDLLAWSIMPNHVHVLIRTKDDLPKIIQSWKSFTGKWGLKNNHKYNLGLDNDAKQFWMPEYWDRFIRDETHFNNTVRYILDNPKKANLKEEHIAYEYRGVGDWLKQELYQTQNGKKQELPLFQELHSSQIKMI